MLEGDRRLINRWKVSRQRTTQIRQNRKPGNSFLGDVYGSFSCTERSVATKYEQFTRADIVVIRPPYSMT